MRKGRIRPTNSWNDGNKERDAGKVEKPLHDLPPLLLHQSEGKETQEERTRVTQNTHDF